MVIAKTETALDWYHRSQRKRAAAEIPTDPSSAAWAFLRGASGIAPLDAAWRIPSVNSNLPAVVLEGSIGKTWTLLSLAARFVVATRTSRFTSTASNSDEEESNGSNNSDSQKPEVVLLDSNFDMTLPKLAYIVRSTLLRESQVDENTLEQELEGCLSRIHIATVDERNDAWVPILECLRCKLKTCTKHPTLLLWDGFHSTVYDSSKQMEVRRQVQRLLNDSLVAMVVTGASSSLNNMSKGAKMDWIASNKQREVHRIRFEKRSEKDCYAIVNGSRLPFSISLGGVLS